MSTIYLFFITVVSKQKQKCINSVRANYIRQSSTNSEDTTSKLSRSKSRKKIPSANRLKQKQDKWNDRFHLQQIPEYNYQNDVFGQGLKPKYRIANKSKEKSQAPNRRKYREVSMDKNRVSNKPNLRLTEEKQKQMIAKAFSDLKHLWFSKNIPEQHIEVMTKILSKQNNPMIVLDEIKHEFFQINKETSLIQKALVSVQIRQSCLIKIKTILDKLEGKIEKTSQIDIQQKLNHLRLLTIHCIECIMQWKQHIQILASGRKLLYRHNGINYFQKIKNDYEMIKTSKLNSMYNFTQKPDPFFLNIMVNNKKVFNVSKNLVKRIKVCQSMIEDSYANDQNANIQNLNIEKKTQSSQHPNLKPPLPPSSMKSIPENNQQIQILQKQTNLSKISIQYSQFNQYFNNLCAKSPIQEYVFGSVDYTKYQQFTILSDKRSDVVLAIDRNSSQRRIVILAINSKLQDIQGFLLNFSRFIWHHDHCSEVRISLLHVPGVNSVLSVNSQVQKKLKGLGFRWVCVNNNENIRTTVYSLKRPLNMKPENAAQSYPVMIEHYCTFNLSKTNVKKYPTSCFMGVLAILKLICETDQNIQQELIQNQDFEPYLQKLHSVVDFVYPGLKAFNVTSMEELQKIVNNCMIKPQVKIPNYMSILNVSFKFRNSIAVDDKFIKVFPDKENQIVICESTYPVYLLPTDEQNINIFIFQVEPSFSTTQIESVFHSMGNQSSFIDEFWIPLFKQQSKYTDELSFQNQIYVSTDYRSKLQSITRRSKTRTRVIKPPFVFGLINKELGQIIEVPFFSTLVSKDDVV